ARCVFQPNFFKFKRSLAASIGAERTILHPIAKRSAMKPASSTHAVHPSRPRGLTPFRIVCLSTIVIVGAALRVGIGAFDGTYPANDVTSSVRVATIQKQLPKSGGSYRVGEPYVMDGRVYVPREEPNYRAEGTASWYGDKFHGRLTANGELFDMFALS